MSEFTDRPVVKSPPRPAQSKTYKHPEVNNAFYDTLGEGWYEDDTHAIALLRAESRIKLAYVRETLARRKVRPPARLLDIGCGAGFISLPLAADGFHVKGIDLAEGALAIAARRGASLPKLEFARGDALQLDESDGSYDAVLLLDFLEHVNEPERALAEAARVLAPGGVAIMHTFNRTFAARMLAVKALELFSRNCPSHVHVYELFIKPSELSAMAKAHGLTMIEARGLRPQFGNQAFWWSVVHRRLHPDFAFTYCRTQAVGYIGYAVKNLRE